MFRRLIGRAVVWWIGKELRRMDWRRLKHFALWVFRAAERASLQTETTVDDKIVLPITDALREALKLPRRER